jgi:uncharacterized protein YdiU (UPF0061 family)
MNSIKNTYKTLPQSFWEEVAPSAAKSPSLIKFNNLLAESLGLKLSNEDILNIFSGVQLPKEISPIAMAYSGHQFGHFVPTLGDGRAILLGEVESKDGTLYDIQLKGCGRTPFSRRGDGLSSLGPVIREYLLSEAMNSLGIPTTRALCATLSGDEVYRDDILPGAIFTRVAKSHIRVGTFEYFASRGLNDELKILADYCINRLYPQLKDSDQKYLELFRNISKSKLQLVSKWMGIGFIHGVMNTDNTSISGETIDYGPCAFIDHFKYNKVFSSIDRESRYAYNNQGQIALWNLSSLANCFISLISENQDESIKILKEELSHLSTYFDECWIQAMGMKFGIFKATREHLPLINNFLKKLQDENLDFTNSFRNLSNIKEMDDQFGVELRDILTKQEQSLDDAIDLMNSVNPYIIPRNHFVEKAIQDSIKGDYGYFNELNEVFKNPYIEDITLEKFTRPPEPQEVVHKTFCGT